MTDAILALNAGSSSLKFGLFERSPDERLWTRARGTIRSYDETSAQATVTGADGTVLLEEKWPAIPAGALIERLLGWIEAHLTDGELVAVGHRSGVRAAQNRGQAGECAQHFQVSRSRRGLAMGQGCARSRRAGMERAPRDAGEPDEHLLMK